MAQSSVRQANQRGRRTLIALSNYRGPLLPADENDLPDHRKRYGFGGFNFRFNDGGNRRSWFRPADRRICIAWRELPDLPITRIRTGQFLVNEDGSTEHLWEGEIRFDE